MNTIEVVAGKKFYKYFSLEGQKMTDTLSALAGMYFWLAKPSDFDDALDNPWAFSKGCGHLIFEDDSILEVSKTLKDRSYSYGQDNDLVLETLRRFSHDHLDEKSEGSELADYDAACLMWEYQQSVEKRIGVFSFSGSPNNPYLWDKFTPGHRGICLEFEFIPYSDGSYPIVGDVDYVRARPRRFSLADILSEEHPENKLRESLFEKHEMYKSESECRLVEYATDGARRLELYDDMQKWDYDLPGDPLGDDFRFREFRHFKITKCILGIGFPCKHLDIVSSVLPPHVEIAEIVMGKNGELELGQPEMTSKYTAGMDRNFTRKDNKRSIDEHNPEGLSFPSEILNADYAYYKVLRAKEASQQAVGQRVALRERFQATVSQREGERC